MQFQSCLLVNGQPLWLKRTRASREMNYIAESLELRRLFSDVSVVDHVLTILGDGSANTIQVVYSTDVAATIDGVTSHYNVADVWSFYIASDGGNDTIVLTDACVGGEVYGGTGNDSIFGGPYNDTIYGGTGVDSIWGSGGDDVIQGGDDADHIWGEGGSDVLHGGAGTDTLDGGDEYDEIHGDGDNDTLSGGAGQDYMLGEGGNDTFWGNDDGESDFMVGGSGNDYFYCADNAADYVLGEDGDDSVGGYDDVDDIYGVEFGLH